MPELNLFKDIALLCTFIEQEAGPWVPSSPEEKSCVTQHALDKIADGWYEDRAWSAARAMCQRKFAPRRGWKKSGKKLKKPVQQLLEPETEAVAGKIIYIDVDGTMMPVKIAIKKNGLMEAITQFGTFEMGKDALDTLVAEMQAQGVTIDNINYETHTHDGVGPMLAYSQPEVER